MKENRLHFHQEQARKLEEIGARLREIRMEKSIPLEDVAAQTRIQARLLNAIEQSRLDQLPEPVYIRGFIKRYAEALGLDGDDLANAFPGGSSLQRIRPSWRHIPVAHLRPFHLYLFYIVLVIGSVNGLSYLVSRSAQEAMNAAGYQSPAPQLPQPSNSLQPSSQQNLGATKVSDAKQFNQDGPVQVGVTLKEKSWIRVVADGKTEFEGVLPEGTQRTWVADEKLIVRAGNAGGVLVEFNNEQAKQMGPIGQVQEVTFAANPRSRS